MTRPRLTTAAAVLLIVAAASAAHAAFISYDLTGTWSGVIKCTELVSGEKQKTQLNPIMRITQVGVNMGVEVQNGSDTDFYGGLANPAVKKPEQKGEAILIRCGTDNELGFDLTDEIARMQASTKVGKVKATFKGFSYVSRPSDPGPHHATCKWKFTRTDTVNQNFPTNCATMLQSPGGAK